MNLELLELAQWVVIAFLVFRVFKLESTQLQKKDLDQIHKNLAEIIGMQSDMRKLR